MAEVFRAQALDGPHKGKIVAMKLLLKDLANDPVTVDAFLGEADLMRSLSHPGIVPILATGVQEDTYYIVMDYVDGWDLGKVIRACAKLQIYLPLDFSCFVVHSVANALEFAHNAKTVTGEDLGIVHCDVTPSNVFISSLGEIHLGDFGVATTSLMGSAFAERGAVGKAHYLAPEQIRGEPLDAATDIFALGALFFEILTNQKAFKAADDGAVIDAILAGKKQSIRQLRPDLPNEVVAIVEKALLERPKRYPSAKTFALDVERCFDPAIGNPLAIASVVRGLMSVA